MKLATLLPLLIGSAVLTNTALAQAQTPAKPTAAPASKPAATKSSAAKPQGKAPAKPLAPPPLPEADEAQLAAVEMAHLGTYDCEFKQSINITRNIKPGYLDVMWQKFTLTMKPVLSSTGALRMEDVSGRTLLIQIGNKSMLMDTKLGQRLVDECIHPKQREAIEAAKAARAAAAASGVPADQGGLGIEPRAANKP